MTTTVTNFANNIDATYPVPGVDNDTQGFRDNFANIKNALKAAASELNSLLLSSVKTTTSNNFNRNEIFRATLKSTGYTTTIGENESGDMTVDLDDGYYHVIGIQGSATISFTGWAESSYSSVKIELSNATTNTTATITFAGIDKKEATLDLTQQIQPTYSTSTTGTIFFEAWSPNAGETVYLRKIGGTFVNV